MVAVGYATLPIIPSLEGIAEKLSAALEKPAAAAAERASVSIEQSMAQAAEKASFALKKAREREETATQKVIDLERKLQQDRGEAARKQDAIQGAELARDRAVADSKATVLAAQRKLDDARASGAATTDELADLERKLESASLSAAETKIRADSRVSAAMDAHKKSLDKVEKTTRDYGTAQAEAADKSEKVLTAQKRLDTQTAMTTGEFKAQQDEAEKLARELSGIGDAADGIGGMFEGLTSKVGGLLGAVAGVAGAGAFAGLGQSLVSEIDMINLQLGYTGSAAEGVGESVREALSSGVAGSAEEAAAAIGALESQWKHLGSEGEQTAGQLADNFLAFSKVFEVDVAEATQIAGQMITLGLAPDVESAADLMTGALQRIPQHVQGEAMDAITEYGVNFANLGFSGEEAFSLIVGAAEGGQYAIDKTADAIKEFSVLAIDPAKAEAFESIGLNAEHMATSVAAGGESARLALESAATGLLDIEDPGKRAALAVEMFGAPIEDLGVDQMPRFLESLTGVQDNMAGVEGASQTLADELAGSLEGRLNTLKGTVQGVAGDAFMALWDVVENKIIPAFESLVSWVQDNETWLKPLAVTVGVLAGAYATMAAQQAILTAGGLLSWMSKLTAVTKLQTAATLAWNVVTSANPLMRVVTVLAAVAAGLVYFFTQTETGKAAWETFTGFLKSAWESVQEKFTVVVDSITAAWDWFTSAIQAGYEGYIKPVIDGIILVFKTLLVVITTVVLTPLQIAWNAVWDGLSWYWENVAKPVFDAIQSAFQIVAEWIQGKIDLIRGKFDELTAKIVELYNTYVAPYLQLVQSAFESMQAWITERIDLVRGGLQALGDKIVELYNTYVQPIIAAIIERFNAFRDNVGLVKDFIVDVAIAGMRDAFNGFRDFVTSVVDGVGNKFSEIRQKFAAPINFVIRTVYTDGLQRVWNGIADKVGGVPLLGDISPIPEYNTGGHVVGPGTGTSDDILAKLSNGEHVLTAAEVEAVGGHEVIYALRKAITAGHGFTFANGQLIELPGRINNRVGDLAGAAPGLFPAFREGGEVRPLWEMQLQKGHEFAKAQHGKPYQWAGPTGPGTSFDCSGFMGSIAAAIQGTDSWRRYWATMSFPTPGAQGFASGLDSGFSVGIWNGGPYGGHTSGTLGPAGPYGAVNVESGGSPSMVKYGPGAAGADDQQHTMRYHLPIGADGAFVSGGSLSAEGMLSVIRQKIESTMDSVLGPIKAQLPQPLTGINAIPHQIVEDVPPKVVDKLFSIVENLGEKLATVYNAVKDVGSLVSDRVKSGVNWMTDRAASAIGLHDQGGWLMPGALATNRLSKPEPVLTPEQWAEISRMVESLPTISPPLKDLISVLEIEARTTWDQRMESLANHLEGIEVNAEGISENTRGRIGTPAEIAQWAGTEIAESLGNEALGLIGLDGLISLPRFLDDDLRVAHTAGQETPDSGVGAVVEPIPVESVAEQSAAAASQSVTMNVTFNNVDPENVEDLQRMVDELADKVADATTSRRTAAAVSRGQSI